MTTASRPRKAGFLARLFAPRARGMEATYAAVVAEARQPIWYRDFAVPDTLDGRFDVLTLVLSLVILRLERAGADVEAVQLTECFIDDMDGQVREIGFGDLGVGKQVGKTVSLLGGRLGVYREALDADALERALWRGAPPAYHVADTAVAHVRALQARIEAVPHDALLAGKLA